MRRLVAGLGLGAVVVSVPAVLAGVSGAPSWPSFRGATLSGDYVPLDSILKVLALAAWALWGYLLIAVLLRSLASMAVSRRLRGADALLVATSLVMPAALRRLVDVALGGVLMASVIAPRHTAIAGVPMRQTVATVQSVASENAAPHKGSPRAVYRVRPGDSLWRISESKLGSGERWREIFELNRGKRFDDGERFINPRLIRPGWDLALPEINATPLRSHAASPVVHPQHRIVRVQQLHPRRPPTATPSVSHRAHQHVEQMRRTDGPVVRLPSGLVVAASFAAGLMSAELVGRLRRRRAARIDEEPEPLAEPSLVTELRFAGAGPSSMLRSALRAIDDAWRAHRQSSPRLLFAVEEDRSVFAILRDDGGSIPEPVGGSIRPLVRFRRADGYLLAEVRGPFGALPGRDQGGDAQLLAPLGRSRDGHVVHGSLHGLGVISVTGQNASGLGREFLLACAADLGPEDLEVMVLGQSPGVGITDLPQCTRAAVDWDGASAAIRELQAELLRRARLFAEESVEDIFEHEELHPDDRLSRIILVANQPPAGIRALVESVGREGLRFGASLLALGWTAEEPGLAVETDEEAVRLQTQVPIPTRLKPLQLDDERALQATELIKSSWESETNEVETVDAPVLQALVVDEERSATDLDATSDDVLVDVPVILETAEVEQAPVEVIVPPQGVAVVRCLGTLQIERDGKPLRKGWRSKSRELVAYLATHPEGASKDRIIDALLPDLDPGAADAEFWRLTSKVRSKVRAHDDVRKYVEKADDLFRLEPDAWWIDVCEFERFVREAESVQGGQRIDELKAALDLYRGDFCDDTYYSWAEPVREHLRRAFVRAAAQLAELLSGAGDNGGALNVLDRATAVEPINEELCRRAMALEAATGHSARALLRYKTLTSVLLEQIGVDPQPATQDLANRIEVDAPKRESYAPDLTDRARSDRSLQAASGGTLNQ